MKVLWAMNFSKLMNRDIELLLEAFYDSSNINLAKYFGKNIMTISKSEKFSRLKVHQLNLIFDFSDEILSDHVIEILNRILSFQYVDINELLMHIKTDREKVINHFNKNKATDPKVNKILEQQNLRISLLLERQNSRNNEFNQQNNRIADIENKIEALINRFLDLELEFKNHERDCKQANSEKSFDPPVMSHVLSDVSHTVNEHDNDIRKIKKFIGEINSKVEYHENIIMSIRNDKVELPEDKVNTISRNITDFKREINNIHDKLGITMKPVHIPNANSVDEGHGPLYGSVTGSKNDPCKSEFAPTPVGRDTSEKENSSSPDDFSNILAACERGDLDVVKAIVKSDKSIVYSMDAQENTPLHFAANGGFRDICDFLIFNGSKIDATNFESWTPLHFACNMGYTDIVESFLDKGAHINSRTAGKLTPLHIASRNGHRKVCELLITRGALINDTDEHNNNALHHASLNGYTDICELLLSKGALINEKGQYGYTPLHCAVFRGHKDVCKLFISNGCNMNEKADNGFTPLHLSCDMDNNDLCEFLITSGANINSVTNNLLFSYVWIHLCILLHRMVTLKFVEYFWRTMHLPV